MLSRRQLRIKVLQALYAFFQSDKTDLAVAERELFRSIGKVYELYIYLLQLLIELADADQSHAGDLHLKYFPSEAEMQAKNRLSTISFIAKLSADPGFNAHVKKFGTSWQKNHELVRKLFMEINKSPEYLAFLGSEPESEKEFLCEVVKKFLVSSTSLVHHIDEENILWEDDFEFVCQMVIRTIRAYYEQNQFQLMSLYKDEADDMEFARELFVKTILHNKEYEGAISERTKNWEVDRIALMDILILKMALAELVSFPGIPVKVSINEYIDISKEYSTPKSKQFVNGIIDKLAADYKEQGKIVKTGRGLIG